MPCLLLGCNSQVYPMGRDQLCHRYSQHAFQCPRLANFLLPPTLECLQTFLVLENVLQNAMIKWQPNLSNPRTAQYFNTGASIELYVCTHRLWQPGSLEEHFRQKPVTESQVQTRASLIMKGKEYLIVSLRAHLKLQPLCLKSITFLDLHS